MAWSLRIFESGKYCRSSRPEAWAWSSSRGYDFRPVSTSKFAIRQRWCSRTAESRHVSLLGNYPSSTIFPIWCLAVLKLPISPQLPAKGFDNNWAIIQWEIEGVALASCHRRDMRLWLSPRRPSTCPDYISLEYKLVGRDSCNFKRFSLGWCITQRASKEAPKSPHHLQNAGTVEHISNKLHLQP